MTLLVEGFVFFLITKPSANSLNHLCFGTDFEAVFTDFFLTIQKREKPKENGFHERSPVATVTRIFSIGLFSAIKPFYRKMSGKMRQLRRAQADGAVCSEKEKAEFILLCIFGLPSTKYCYHSSIAKFTKFKYA